MDDIHLRSRLLLEKHIKLEEELGDGDSGNFLSGWQCENPYKEQIAEEINSEIARLDGSKYLYQDNYPKVEENLIDWHSKVDISPPERIQIASGSTQLLWIMAAWLSNNKINEVFYLSPIYHVLHFALKTFSIRARPINRLHPYEPNFCLNLPNCKTVLFITDPIWYAGKSIPSEFIVAIAAWQSKTGSLVIIDASFDYMNWSEVVDIAQNNCNFDSGKTVRLICPSKQIAMHGYRASYALVPKILFRELSTIGSMLNASLSIDSLGFYLSIPKLIHELNIPKKIVEIAKSNHINLRRSGVIESPWDPDCGYFCFEKIRGDFETSSLMGGDYFDQKSYAGFYRINLLSPQISILKRYQY